VQTVAAKIAKLPAANWSEIVSGHTADCSLHWVVVSSGDASDSPGQVLFFDRKSLIGTPTPDPTDIAAVQYMASGPRAGVLPNGHGHGPVQNRRRQARGARSHSQPIATRRARCHRRSRTQRR
jgi:LppP/LprE lipoprotein